MLVGWVLEWIWLGGVELGRGGEGLVGFGWVVSARAGGTRWGSNGGPPGDTATVTLVSQEADNGVKVGKLEPKKPQRCAQGKGPPTSHKAKRQT